MKKKLFILFISTFIGIQQFYAQSYDGFMQQGAEALRTLDRDYAIELFTEAIKLDSTSIEAFYMR